MARFSAGKLLVLATAMAITLGQGTARANGGDDIPTLDRVVAEADSIQSFWLMLAPMWGFGLTPEYDSLDPIGAEDDCASLMRRNFILGCSTNGMQERNTLRSANSYAAGSSMYKLLEYANRSDTGLFATSEFNSALNAFEYKWQQGVDLSQAASDFFGKVFIICQERWVSGAFDNHRACLQSAGTFLIEMAEYINPQTRNNYIDRVLADWVGVRPTYSSGLGLSFSYKGNGFSFSMNFQDIPNAIPSYKSNLFKDVFCQMWRNDMREASCPIG
jgi:hypothetical protein